MNSQSIKGKHVVVTGASSGIGKATALRFADEGAHLYLAARGEEGLQATQRECQEKGSKVEIAQLDIADAEAVHKLAQDAAAFFDGEIDVWINDPGVGAVGPYDQVPMSWHERVVKTNLLGYMNGAHAVLPYFKRQGHGIMINLNSLGAWMPSPYAASYSATKFGLRGFTEALRYEIRKEKKIHICDLFPGFVNSPGVAHGGNDVGVELKPMPPTLSAFRIGNEVVKMAKKPREHKMIGTVSIISRLSYALVPGLAMRLLAKTFEHHFKTGKRVPPSSGSLFEATPGISAVEDT